MPYVNVLHEYTEDYEIGDQVYILDSCFRRTDYRGSVVDVDERSVLADVSNSSHCFRQTYRFWQVEKIPK